MARILADTNVLLRSADPGSADHAAALRAVARLLNGGHDVCICPQNMIEFWAVATRPSSANGLGWTLEQTATEISELEGSFRLLPEAPDIFTFWKQLVLRSRVRGKRTHDARLVAVCLTHGMDGLLTFNGPDFRSFSEIMVIDPRDPGSFP